MAELTASTPLIPPERVASARPNVFEIDLDAIGRCARAILDAAGPKVAVFAALKANGYGFGLIEVARTAVDAGIYGVSVVDRSHAVTLRHNGITAPMLVYPGNTMDEAGARVDLEFDLIPTITQRSVAELYARIATKPIRIAVKIDAGQERLGILDSEAAAFIAALVRLPNLQPHIVYAHPNVPAGDVDRYIEWQYRRFTRVCEQLDQARIEIPVRLFASSKVLSRATSMMLTGIDPGQMLFGLWPLRGVQLPRAFRALKSRIAHIRVIDRSEFLEQAAFPVRPGLRLGVIPMGAADGIASLNCGHVLVRGRRVKILGPPNLEHTRLDLTELPDAAIGDEAVIIGGQGGSEISQEQVVSHLGLGGLADLALAVRSSIPRRYIGGSRAKPD